MKTKNTGHGLFLSLLINLILNLTWLLPGNTACSPLLDKTVVLVGGGRCRNMAVRNTFLDAFSILFRKSGFGTGQAESK